MSTMLSNARKKRVALTLVMAALTVLTVAGTAAAQASVDENVTAMKENIVSTLAQWVPFVVLFSLLGVALSAIGLGRIFRSRD